MSEKIQARIIIEMLGKPAEHLIETMKQLIEQLGKEPNTAVAEYKIAAPKQLENSMFSIFGEVSLEANSVNTLFSLLFSYMPSHIEILSPAEIKMTNFQFNEIVNELQRRLHKYDEIAKRVYFENTILRRQMEEAGIKPAVEEMVQRAKKGEAEKETEEQGRKKKKGGKKGKKKKAG
ncbi:MAG: hypothetical protein AABX65_02245 [Nanoarchaeota archaeon]